MQQAVKLAQRMSKQLDKNWLPELEEINIHKLFYPVYTFQHNIITLNTIVAYIILAYDSDSGWINLKQNRLDNKLDILKSLDANADDEIYQSILNLETTDIQDVIHEYLQRQIDWKFKTIIACFDYHSKHIRSATEPIAPTVIDELEKAKINKTKGELLKESIRQRTVGEELLLELKKDHVKLDHVTQSEFGFMASDIEKTDPLSWRQYIRNLKKKQPTI